MKIYRHEINYYADKVRTREFEVEEKPKTYKFLEPAYITSIRKSQIGTLDYNSMYTLTPDPRPFLLTLIASKEQNAMNYYRFANDAQEKADKIKRLLAEVQTA